ncbi:MAG: hypothetical protein H8E82_08160 [Candidatus Marinimicrobia bacterium]|nr:hypothetical protein [Candidatus Neomarinimicrobiota bacterium]
MIISFSNRRFKRLVFDLLPLEGGEKKRGWHLETGHYNITYIPIYSEPKVDLTNAVQIISSRQQFWTDMIFLGIVISHPSIKSEITIL